MPETEENNSTETAEEISQEEQIDESAAQVASTENETEKDVVDESSKIAELEEELSDLKDKFLRKQADFENYRKRMAREKQEAAQFANQKIMEDIIVIIDDFERAIKSSENSEDFSAFHDGIIMIEKQFTSMLERKWGLTRFDSENEEFDPQRHEAVMSEPNEEHEVPMVLEDFQKGYLLHDRIIRPAKVKVSAPVPKSE